MKMRIRDSKGFGAVELLLMIVIVAALGFTGWYVWHAKKSTNATLDKATEVTTTRTSKVYRLSFDASKLPSGWSADNAYPISVSLTNTGNTCWVGVFVTADPRESYPSNTAALQAAIVVIKNKGYTAEVLGNDVVRVATTRGNKELNATILKVSGNGSVSYEEMAASSSTTPKAGVTVSCNAQADLIPAKAALAAITVEGL